MVKVISQESFNEAVIEMMDLLDLGIEEAIKEVVSQYDSQGVDISTIIKTSKMVNGIDEIQDCLDKLQSATSNDYVNILTQLRLIISRDIAHKLLAGKKRVYNIIIDVVTKEEVDKAVLIAALETECTLLDGYPDLLDEIGIEFIFNSLNTDKDSGIIKALLKLLKKCCIKHEYNRQAFVDNNIVKILSGLLNKNSEPDIIRAACGVVTCLTLDDDIRVAVPQAHVTASLLANELLSKLVPLIKAYAFEELVICDIMNALSAILVRNEFCELVSKANGVNHILEILVRFPDNEKVMKRCFMVLSSLSGNDDVKDLIVNYGAGPLIIYAMSINSASLSFNIAACNLIGRLCLRSQKNSKELFNLGCAELIIQAMKVFNSSSKLQGSSCRALRNMSSRNEEIKSEIIKMNIEEIVYNLMATFKECEEDAKQLLVELGCKVELRELWTGLEGDKLKGH